MFALRVFFTLLHLISITTLVQSESVCLVNSNIVCYCVNDNITVACTENRPSDESFIDWSTFISDEHQRHSFDFINFTRLTSQTFTSFSSKFPSLRRIQFNFINGIDQVAESIFSSLNYPADVLIAMDFKSPRNFQLTDYAFSTQMTYQAFTIENIQYSDIYNQPYELNLKAFYNTTMMEIDILNSNQIQLMSNESLTLYWDVVRFNNCTLTNVNYLIDSLYAESLTELDLSSCGLPHIPSLTKFPWVTSVSLRDNYISEVRSNLFSNMNHLYQLDLSYNQIKRISHDAFVGLQLGSLTLDNNHLTALEYVTSNNEVMSFLSPLNETLGALSLSNNFIRDIDSIRNLPHLHGLTMCCNQIQKLDEDFFKNIHRIQAVDFSYNQIDVIHPFTFNRTALETLDLSSNPISSLETVTTFLDEHSQPKNQTTSFLYSAAGTLRRLSLAQCTSLSEINWFVFTKLEQLTSLDLSGIVKTNRFWRLESTDSTSIQSNQNVHHFAIILNDIQFNNDDYCLSKAVFRLFNQSVLFLDKNHSCNCFTFKLKNLIDTKQSVDCLSDPSVVERLTRECMNIDAYCSPTIITTVKPKTTDDEKWKTIVAIVIPLTITTIVLSLIGIYIVKTRNANKSKGNVELTGGIVNILATQ